MKHARDTFAPVRASRPRPAGTGPHDQARRRALRAMVIVSGSGLGGWLPGSADEALALDLSGLTRADATAGLREALVSASTRAVAQLGQVNGFLGNPEIRIALPATLQRVEPAMKMLGMQGQFDALVEGMNRAAEAAMPQARSLIVGAITSMSVQDAKGILSGGEQAATAYFRSRTSEPLRERLMPIVRQQISRIGLASQYNELAGAASRLGLVRSEQASIEGHVTSRAIDGLFHVIGQQEAALRRDPVGTGSALLQRIFRR